MSALAASAPDVRAVLTAARQRCTGNAAAASDLSGLLALALDVPRAWLVAHGEQVLGDEPLERFEALLVRRLAGEPMAYLRGRQGFWSLELEVTPGVLVPRPETELLVELALARMGEVFERPRSGPDGRARVVDLGTGSGAIALALASERPDWQVLASDTSAAALAVARRNAARLGLHLDLRLGEWLQPFASERFDLIVSNPPYIAATDPCLLADGLRCEPRAALAAGADGLADLAAIAAAALAHLTPGGWLLLEHGADQGAAVQALLTRAGFAAVETHADLAGRPRVTLGQMPCAN